MTIKQLEKKIQAATIPVGRAGMTAFYCLTRGITDPEKIQQYIIKAYTVPSQEFPGRKLRTPHFANRMAKNQLDWLKANKLI